MTTKLVTSGKLLRIVHKASRTAISVIILLRKVRSSYLTSLNIIAGEKNMVLLSKSILNMEQKTMKQESSGQEGVSKAVLLAAELFSLLPFNGVGNLVQL